MGTYRVPRNTKGESRILLVFSTKALIYTVVGIGIGYMINYVLKFMGISGVGMVIMAILALLGFSIATFKVPNIGSLPITKEIAGEPIDEVLIRYIKYRKSSKKIYTLNNKTKEEEKNDGK